MRMRERGMSSNQISLTLRRSPERVERMLSYAAMPGRQIRPDFGGLRPLERRVLHWRSQGIDHTEIARRFRKSASYIRRVEGLARLRQGWQLLREV